MFIFHFWCDHCHRYVDDRCKYCSFFLRDIFERYQSLAIALDNLKCIFDDCADVTDIKTKARLNMASAFDTAIVCFDDSISLGHDKFVNDYSSDNLPDQFELQFFGD